MSNSTSNSTDTEEDRIRTVFGLPGHSPLPEVGKDSLLKYHEYLTEKLTFPFQALYAEINPPVRQLVRYVAVVGLSDSPNRRRYGLFCKVQLGEDLLEVALADLGMPEDSPVQQLVDDYLYWLWNSR